jgi:hypothetical protein
MAERMVSHFGTEIMHIIDDEPGRLVEVPGLGPKRGARIKDAWAEQKAIKEVMIFLQGVGVSTSLAVKIYKKYGDESIDTVKQRPYQLALPEHALIADATKILGVPADLIAPLIPDLAAEELAVRDEVPVPGAGAAGQLQAVYLPPFYHSERSLASSLRRLLSCGADRLGAFQAVDWDKAFAWLKAKTGADLAPEQADAVKLALTQQVAVLTGGPGCGKSFTVRSVVELARARNAKIVLAAPTGHEAATIHRLLKLQPGGDPEFDAKRHHPREETSRPGRLPPRPRRRHPHRRHRPPPHRPRSPPPDAPVAPGTVTDAGASYAWQLVSRLPLAAKSSLRPGPPWCSSPARNPNYPAVGEIPCRAGRRKRMRVSSSAAVRSKAG